MLQNVAQELLRALILGRGEKLIRLSVLDDESFVRKKM